MSSRCCINNSCISPRGYGHRLTARYNVNNDSTIDDDPVDVYAYDRLWRVRTVTRATPSGSSAEATWTYYVREKWYYHDSESGQEMMTGPNSTDAPIMRLIDRNGDGDFGDAGEEQHFVNDHQGSTVLVTGKATLDPTTGNLISRAPIIAHVKYDQYGVPKFVHPADVNSDGVVDALDTQHWLNAWREYRTHNTTSNPPSEIWKGTVDSNESGIVDESTDGADPTQPSATNTDWVAFQNQYAAATVGNPPSLAEQLGNLPLYAGYWWDDAIGLYHVRHRVYRPEWGRWLQRDPLGYAPGWNLYQYVNGMPWSAVDPMGLWGIGEWFSDLWESIKGIASTPSDAVSTANQMGQLKRQRNNAEEQNAYMVIDRNENRALYQEATNRPNSKDFNYAASTAASAVDIVVRNTAPTADAIESTAEALDRVFDSPNLANISLLGLALFVSQPGGAIGKEAAACGAKASGQLHHAISRRVHAALELHPVLKGVYKARDNRFVTRAKDLPSHIGYGDWHIALDDEVIQWLSDNPSANPAEFENWLRSRYEHDDLKSRFPSGLMD